MHSTIRLAIAEVVMKVTIDQFLKLQKRVSNFDVMLGGGADRLCTPSTSAGPFRIFSVAGFQNRANDIVYCPPVIRQPSQNVEDSNAVVYFGGDVQDFPESMETNRDSRGYMKYNLENSAILLREAFPRSHIIVIRPVRMEFKTFSCFDNFVRGNNAGVPDHTPMNHALQHLEKLLQNLSQRLISIPENEIMDQAAQAAAAAVAVAALVSSTLSNNATDTTAASQTTQQTTTTTTDSNQEMDIDILQVQEHVTVVYSDGTLDFPNITDNNGTSKLNKDSTTTAATPAKNNTDYVSVSKMSSDATTITTTTATATTIATTTTTKTTTSQMETSHNDIEHQNNLNNGDQQQIKPATEKQQTQQAEASNSNPLWWRENLNLDKAKLVLIGFSKGCVVLNQFIYEFHYLKTLTPDDSTMVRLLSRIKDIYWLDGGHGGQKNTWITSRSLLETLTRMGINIHVHLTPYQVQDDRRPWIRKEEKIFTDMLRRLGAAITRHLHYDSQTANLMTHFEVLQAFCQHIHAQNQQAGAQANVDMINAEQNVNNQCNERQDNNNATLGNNTIERLTVEAANEEK